MAVVLEHRVALAVAGAIGVVLANGQRRGSPTRAALVVAQVDDFRLRIAHRIVVPRRQAIGLAVAAPRESQSAFAHQRAEVRIGHDVGPRRGRLASGSQIDRVLAPVRGESAQAVEVRQFEERQRDGRLLCAAAGSNKRRWLRTLASDRELLLQRAAAAAQHHARSGQQQIELVLREIAPIAQKYAAGPIVRWFLRE